MHPNSQKHYYRKDAFTSYVNRMKTAWNHLHKHSFTSYESKMKDVKVNAAIGERTN